MKSAFNKELILCACCLIFYCVTAIAFEPLPGTPPTPKNNPITPAKIELGKKLFFDPRLSIDGTVSCNSCHNVMYSGTDNRPVSVGVKGKKGGRSAPTVWNAAYLSVQFWDGRSETLEEQAKGPILNPIEMGMPDKKSVIKRLKNIKGYQQMFAAAFGGKSPITYDNLAKAIATYERTLITPNSPVDKYLRGDRTALSRSALRGMKTIKEIGCDNCHSGINYAGPKQKMGKGFFQKFPTYTKNAYIKKYKLLEDKGLYEVTKKSEDKHMWRVPTWRNVALTAPYFHNGSVKRLDEAVRVMAKTQLDKDLSPRQVKDIVAFLQSLTGEFPEQTLPKLPETSTVSLVGDQ